MSKTKTRKKVAAKTTKRMPIKVNIAKLEVERKNLLFNLYTSQAIVASNSTHWEELTCVGFNHDRSQLIGVVSVKQSSGYNSGLCYDGSTEYVRFFIDWGDGNGFQNIGLTSFKAYNISDLPPGPQHPIQYMVYLNLDDEDKRKCCNVPYLPKVRGILSWQDIPPDDPDFVPHYGNSLDASIQIQPLDTSILCLLNEGVILKDSILLENIDLKASLPKIKPIPTPWSKLVAKYKEFGVPDHRTAYDVIYPMLKGKEQLHLAMAQPDLMKLKELEIDAVKAFNELTLVGVDELGEVEANVTFEEIVCVGLNTASDTLGAVIHVKKPNGYGGNLCQTGTQEHVAFWADWNNDGTFEEYLGTASIDSHDINTIPAEGLYYGVFLHANFSQHLKDCSDPSIVRIRAVLSWSVQPSTVDPEDLNYWGNRVDVVVQIRPGSLTADLMELLYDVGNVPIDAISSTTYMAYPSTGTFDPDNCTAPALDRPYGGTIRIGGRIYRAGYTGIIWYRVEYSPHGANSWLPVTHSHTFELMHPNPADPLYPMEVKTVHSIDGWFEYQEDELATPQILERTSRLAIWDTGALEGTYDLRLAYSQVYPVMPTSVTYSDVVTIVVDNTNYTVSPTPNAAVDMAYRLDLVIDGGDCHSYNQGDVITGHLRAIDDHFWKWVLEVQPSTHTHGTETSPPCRHYVTLTDVGDGNFEWELDTTNLDPCGYTVMLWAYDRAIVNGNGAVVHWQKKAVGFAVNP